MTWRWLSTALLATACAIVALLPLEGSALSASPAADSYSQDGLIEAAAVATEAPGAGPATTTPSSSPRFIAQFTTRTTWTAPGPSAAPTGRVLAAKAGDAARKTFIASDGTEIVGFTNHGINRAIGDGAKRAGTRPEALLDAIKTPTKITESVDDLGRPYPQARSRAKCCRAHLVSPGRSRICDQRDVMRRRDSSRGRVVIGCRDSWPGRSQHATDREHQRSERGHHRAAQPSAKASIKSSSMAPSSVRS